MGIERIEIEGFRSLKHVVWEPSNLNVLIGPNGAGKSNVLRALEVVSAGVQGKLDETVAGMGGIAALSWNYSTGNIVWKIRIGELERGYGFRFLQTRLFRSMPEPEYADYELSLDRYRHMGEFFIKAERLHQEEMMLIDRSPRGSKIALGHGKVDQLEDVGAHELILGMRGPRAMPVKNFVQKSISGWTCYQDLSVAADADIRRASVSQRADQVHKHGQNLVSVLHTHYGENLDFRNAINDAMSAAFGEDFAELIIAPAEDTRVQLRLRWKSLSEPHSGADLSDGILRFLLLITILSQPNPPSLIAIDEPETGLHPSMLPIIAECAVEASERTQVILTTHSPEMLSAFRDVVPKVTVALWEDGQTVLKTPPDDVLQHWLKEYSLGNLMSSGQLEEMAK